jgi:hypothetical protein
MGYYFDYLIFTPLLPWEKSLPSFGGGLGDEVGFKRET